MSRVCLLRILIRILNTSNLLEYFQFSIPKSTHNHKRKGVSSFKWNLLCFWQQSSMKQTTRVIAYPTTKCVDNPFITSGRFPIIWTQNDSCSATRWFKSSRDFSQHDLSFPSPEMDRTKYVCVDKYLHKNSFLIHSTWALWKITTLRVAKPNILKLRQAKQERVRRPICLQNATL